MVSIPEHYCMKTPEFEELVNKIVGKTFELNDTIKVIEYFCKDLKFNVEQRAFLAAYGFAMAERKIFLLGEKHINPENNNGPMMEFKRIG